MKITKKEPDGRALDGRLFEQIQPHGGITFANPAYTRMGDGYCQCLHIYALPNTLDTHWLNQIFTVNRLHLLHGYLQQESCGGETKPEPLHRRGGRTSYDRPGL